MESNEQYHQNQKNKLIRNSLIASIILLLSALIVMIIFINRGNKLNAENLELQTEQTLLKEENQDLLNEKNKNQEEVARLKKELADLKLNYEEKLRNKDAQISSLRVRTGQTEQMRKQIEEYRMMEAEYKKLQNEHAVLLADQENFKGQIEKLSEEIKKLQQGVELSKGLSVYNISPLTKWERWLWADRYNVFRARRVDETAITFEIAGNNFTETGNRIIYLNMIDPQGEIMYPSTEQFMNKETGMEIPYTQKKEINFTGDNVIMNFVVSHPKRLSPGTYRIIIYIDGDLIRSGQISFE